MEKIEMHVYLKAEMFEEYRKKNNLTKKEFCMLCGITETMYERILHGYVPKRRTLIEGLARVINKPTSLLYSIVTKTAD